MKHALIIAHPNPESFAGAAAKRYAASCQALGHEVVIRDLYRIGFDPRLGPDELPWSKSFHLRSDVAEERRLIGDSDVFAFFYPLWLNTPPAMVKGYLERVFGYGFAYGGAGHSYDPLLTGRKLISFTSSGSPQWWLKQTGALDALCVLFDEYLAKLCGMSSVDHIHVGGLTPGASASFVHARLADVEKTVKQHFGDIHVPYDHQA